MAEAQPLPNFEDLLARLPAGKAASLPPGTRENYQGLSKTYNKKCPYPLLLLAIARYAASQGAIYPAFTMTKYGSYLDTEYSKQLELQAKFHFTHETFKSSINTILNEPKVYGFENVQEGGRPHITMLAVALDMAEFGLTATDIFSVSSSPSLANGASDRPEGFLFSPREGETAFASETVETRKRFFQLRKRYPNADNDYALLLIARHAKREIGQNDGAYNGVADMIAVADARLVHLIGVMSVLTGEDRRQTLTPAINFLVYIEGQFKLRTGTLWRAFENKRRGVSAKVQPQPAQEIKHTVRNTAHLTPVGGAAPYIQGLHRPPRNIEEAMVDMRHFEYITECPILAVKRFVAIEFFERKPPTGTDRFLQLLQHINPNFTWDDVNDLMMGHTDRFPAVGTKRYIGLSDFFEAFAAIIGENYTAAELAAEYNAHTAALARNAAPAPKAAAKRPGRFRKSGNNSEGPPQ